MIITFIKNKNDEETAPYSKLIFKERMFIMLRVSGDIATIIFLITGLILKSKVSELPNNTEYEQRIVLS